MVVAWRITYLMREGRTSPIWMPHCSLMPVKSMAPTSWRKRNSQPKHPPSTRVVRLIAQLGGFLARKGGW
jgi:hypothetical protein